MKLKRLGALCLSLALTISLAVVPAHGAVTPFTDLPDYYGPGLPHWATEYIEDMHQRSYAGGFEDGKFYPESTMSATEALLFCARVTSVDQSVRDQIYAARGEEVAALLPELNSTNVWAAPEMSVAVEAGVISLEELEALGQTAPASVGSSVGARPYLLWNISRENVCRYLVRAMQLEPLALSFPDEACLTYLRSCYADADDISPDLRPYLYVLTYYKVFSGMDNDDGVRIANPKGSVKRCEMTVLMSQGLKVMDELGIEAELSEYTDYEWAAGRITEAAIAVDGSVSLTLTSDITGSQAYRVPAGAKIYEDNLLSDASYLRNGKYVRLNLNDKGEVVSARISGALTTYTGTVVSVGEDHVAILAAGVGRSFAIDRFTQVLAGTKAGDRAVIDPEAGYTTATCYVDEMGHLAGVKLMGGTTQVAGLISGMALAADGSASLSLAGFDGVVSTYAIPAAAAVTVNGAAGALATPQVGRYAMLRVEETTGLVTGVAVDTLTAYVQGRILRQGTLSGNKTLVIANVLDGSREESAALDANAVITYEGEERTAAQIENGWFVTARLFSGSIVELEAYPATATVTGTLNSITYGTTTVLEVALADGSSAVYSVDVSNPPTITRDGAASTIAQLRTGDALVITLRYNELSKIAATPREADLTGVVSSISSSLTGRSITVTAADGTAHTFSVEAGVSVTRNGVTATFNDVNAGDTVALVTSGDQVLSINITAVASSDGMLTGTVYTVTNAGNTKAITILVAGRADPVTVDLRAKSASIIDRSNKSLTMNSLAAGDTVVVFGSYSGSTFQATMVVKQ